MIGASKTDLLKKMKNLQVNEKVINDFFTLFEVCTSYHNVVFTFANLFDDRVGLGIEVTLSSLLPTQH